MPVLDWLRERVPLSLEKLKAAGNEPVPGHMKLWWFALGGTPAMLLFGQVATGLMLCVYYQPTPDHAWDSVRRIMEDIPFGWWFRSLHKWGANIMIIGVSLHLMRVFFTGAYRRPREVNWMIGAILFVLTLLLGFTGYSLVYEQLSFWGATVASNITASVPVVGPSLAYTMRGGERVGAATLSRFFILHAAVLPMLVLALFSGHIALVRLHGVTKLQFSGEEKPTHFPFFPDHVLRELSVGLILITLTTCLAVISPVELGPRADPMTTPAHIKPEWYFYFTFRWLKVTSLGWGVAGVTAALGFLVFWPFVDALIRRKRPGSELSVGFGAAAILGFLVLTVWEAFS